jgi:hypothetical protein
MDFRFLLPLFLLCFHYGWGLLCSSSLPFRSTLHCHLREVLPKFKGGPLPYLLTSLISSEVAFFALLPFLYVWSSLLSLCLLCPEPGPGHSCNTFQGRLTPCLLEVQTQTLGGGGWSETVYAGTSIHSCVAGRGCDLVSNRPVLNTCSHPWEMIVPPRDSISPACRIWIRLPVMRRGAYQRQWQASQVHLEMGGFRRSWI